MPFPDPDEAIEGTEIPQKSGMGDKDLKILKAMIENGFIRPEQMWFNQVVGQVDPEMLARTPQNLKEWFVRTYSKRPDVMFTESGQLFAAEVKPFASYVALGQALMYRFWANIKADPPRLIIPIILTDIPDPDLIPVAAERGVDIRQLGMFLEDRPRFQT